MLEGVIFDWDGVIIDSRRQHQRSWEMLASEENLVWQDEWFAQGFGRRNPDIIPNLYGWTEDPAEIARLADRKEALYRELVVEMGLSALPGVAELLKELAKARIPFGVGSSTPRSNLDAAIPLLGLPVSFDVIVAGEDVAKGKPDPEVFLRCAEFLRVPPQASVVIEDAHVGVQAAKAGGMKCVAVATTHRRETFHDPAPDLLLDDMSQVSLDRLQSLF